MNAAVGHSVTVGYHRDHSSLLVLKQPYSESEYPGELPAGEAILAKKLLGLGLTRFRADRFPLNAWCEL